MLALSGAMLVLAAVPSVSVLTVSARSASAGFTHGALAAVGVVAGDLCFILLAMLGLALLVEAMGSLSYLLQYLGGAYLIGLGIVLWRRRSRPPGFRDAAGASRLSSFASGLLVTLGDQKAILFYLGFLPAFFDLNALAVSDIVAIVAITILTVGGVKLGYAYAAHKAGRALGGKAGHAMRIAAACTLIGVGLFALLAG